VARRAGAAGVPGLAVGGAVTAEGAAVLAAEGCVTLPVLDRPISLRDAMTRATPLVVTTGERLARLVALGRVVHQRRGLPA
jgi:glycerate kinase